MEQFSRVVLGYHGFASEEGSIPSIMGAIAKTRTYKELQKLARSVKGPAARDIKELALESEVFARAYSQWVATRSGHPELMAGLRADRGDDLLPGTKHYGTIKHWSDAEFAPVAAAFDEHFRKLGLLHERREGPG